MSGPIAFGEIGGAINSFTLGERPELNGLLAQMRIDFEWVNDEAVWPIVLGRRLTGKSITEVGSGEATMRLPQRS